MILATMEVRAVEIREAIDHAEIIFEIGLSREDRTFCRERDTMTS